MSRLPENNRWSYEYTCPFYTLSLVPDREEIVIAGGGGSAKTGIPNGLLFARDSSKNGLSRSRALPEELPKELEGPVSKQDGDSSKDEPSNENGPGDEGAEKKPSEEEVEKPKGKAPKQAPPPPLQSPFVPTALIHSTGGAPVMSVDMSANEPLVAWAAGWSVHVAAYALSGSATARPTLHMADHVEVEVSKPLEEDDEGEREAPRIVALSSVPVKMQHSKDDDDNDGSDNDNDENSDKDDGKKKSKSSPRAKNPSSKVVKASVMVASGSDNGAIRIYTVSSKELKELTVIPGAASSSSSGAARGHKDSINGLVWHPKGQPILISSGSDKAVFVWDALTGAVRAKLSPVVPKGLKPDIAKRLGFRSVRWAPSGSSMYTLSSAFGGGGYVTAWDTTSPTPKAYQTLQVGPKPMTAMGLSRSGTHLSFGSAEGDLVVYEIEQSGFLTRMGRVREAHDLFVTGIDVNEETKTVWSVAGDGTVCATRVPNPSLGPWLYVIGCLLVILLAVSYYLVMSSA